MLQTKNTQQSTWLNRMPAIKVTILLLLLLVGCTATLDAQVGNATLNGTIQDPTGAAIPGAHITLLNVNTGTSQTLFSNDSGLYLSPALQPGVYSITAEKAGFEKSVQESITLTVGQVATVNVALHLGDTSETITISADTILVNSSTPEISQVINEHAVKELPLNGRDPSSLVLLTTGVSNVLHAAGNAGIASFNGESLPDETGASAGGGRQGSTYYLLDGSPNMDTYMLLAAPFPNADATQEFRVISNNFDAQYGFSPGAVVSIATKSGENAFHGGAFEFLRNNALNAGNYFSHAVDPLKRNQFGGYLGGPVLKDKLFFFVNYQATRASTQSATNVAFTPTQAMLNGDFSAVPITLNPTYFTTISGKPNQIIPGKFSPGALALAKAALPLGQNPVTGQLNVAGASSKSSYNEGTGRIDYTVNNSQRLNFRSFIQYYSQPVNAINGNLLAVSNGISGNYFNEAFSHEWTINPSTVHVVSLFWTQLNSASGAQAKDTNGNPVCLSEYIQVSDPVGGCYLIGLNVNGGGNGGFSSGYNIKNLERRTTYGLTDGVTKMLGKNTITFGGIALHQFSQENSDYPQQPIVSFTSQYTGFGLADFLVGTVYNLQQGAGEISSVRGWQFGLYAQDQYKPFNTVTVTAGLRWDPNTPPSVAGGRGVAFRQGQQSTRFPNAPLGLVFPGDAGVDDALMPTTYGYFEPRVGVAWQPRTHTSVRAGFGLFEAPLPYSYYNHTSDIAPFSPTFSLFGPGGRPVSFDNPWNGTNPFPPFASVTTNPASNSTFTTPVQISAAFAPNFKLGITQSWNFTVEQQFTQDLALHMSYVGSQSYHQAVAMDLNPGINNVRTSYTKFGQILEDTTAGTASYHSLQIGLEKRLSHSLQVQSNFTWSKIIDLASTGNISQGGVPLPDPFNLRFNRGISDLNVPYISVNNFVYTTPALKGWNGFARAALGEWEVSAIWTFQSGTPFGIQGGNGNNNSGALQASGQYGDRANVTGQPFKVHQGGRTQWLQQYFNTNAFTPNPVGTFGNSGKNILVGPGIDTGDAALIKNWRVRETDQLQFRWEMFNAFNHPSFGLPDTSPTDSNFGQITAIGAIPPRVMQAGVKLSF
jgi:outer membrane receptor protein involved in Fe transport